MAKVIQLRELTLPASADLVADLVWRNQDGYGQHVAIFGVPHLSAVGDPVCAVTKFVRDESGPISIVIVQVGDSPNELVFVTHEISNEVAELLAALGVDTKRPSLVRPYRQLGTASLESLYGIDD